LDFLRFLLSSFFGMLVSLFFQSPCPHQKSVPSFASPPAWTGLFGGLCCLYEYPLVQMSQDSAPSWPLLTTPLTEGRFSPSFSLLFQEADSFFFRMPPAARSWPFLELFFLPLHPRLFLEGVLFNRPFPRSGILVSVPPLPVVCSPFFFLTSSFF